MRRRRRNGIIAVIAVIAVLAAAAVFLAVFYVSYDDVEILGSTRYRDDEILQIAMPGFIDHNSMYLRLVKKSISTDDVPFINSIDTEYITRNKIRLHVNEDYPVGYILQDGYRFYFDSVGLVIESIENKEQQTGQDAVTAAAAETDAGTGQENVTDADIAAAQEQDSGADTAAAQEQVDGAEAGAAAEDEDGAGAEAGNTASEDTGFRPAVSDVAPVSGLAKDRAAVGKKLDVEDPGIFLTLLTVSKLFNKFGIMPDEVRVSDGSALSLIYGDVEISLGDDQMLEEKISRAAAILPQLKGMSGTLHLENFSDETMNIIFDTGAA